MRLHPPASPLFCRARRLLGRGPATACWPLILLGALVGCHRLDDAQAGPRVAVRLVSLGREATPTGLPAISVPAPEGRAPASKLTSLSMLITQIQLCENLKPDSQGIGGGALSCVDVYRLDDPPDAAVFDAAAARTDPRYIDLLDPNQQLWQAAPMAVPAKSYAFGLVRWVGPAKLVAEVPLADGSGSLFTHDGELRADDQSTQAPDLTVGPAGEALAVQGVQEGWFRFYDRFDLRTVSTPDKAEPVQLDLAFDADALVGGTRLTPPQPSIVDAAGHSILLPPLDLNPLPFVAARPLRVETYILRQTKLTAAPFDLRLSLYVWDDAPDTVLSVDLRSSPVSGSPTNPAAQKPVFVDQDMATGDVSLINYDYLPIVSELVRGAKVGDISQAQLPCNGVLPALVAAGCTSGQAAVDVELAAISLLQP